MTRTTQLPAGVTVPSATDADWPALNLLAATCFGSFRDPEVTAVGAVDDPHRWGGRGQRRLKDRGLGDVSGSTSEGGIYGRFGYGPAGIEPRLRVQRRSA